MQTKYIPILLLLFLLWGARTTADELPDLGERSETFISPKEEKRLGKEFMKEVRLNMPIVNDIIINDYIQHLGNKLASYTNSKKELHFFVVDDSSINAFAGPGAYIGINSGTITKVKIESELAAVMAHEIAHVVQHHIERLIERVKNTQLAAAAGVLAAIIIGSTIGSKPHKDPITNQTTNNNSASDLTTGIAVASMGGAIQHIINFTREHEIEADNIGMKILYKSSFDPKAMPNVFEHMQNLRYDYANETPRLLLTHPVTGDRIAEAKNRANQYHPKETNSQETFDLIRIRTLVLTTHNSPNAIKNLQEQLKHQKSSKELQYGYALALYENLQFSEATNIVNSLLKEYPNEVLFQMLKAQLAAANKQIESSLDILKTALTNNGNYYPLIIQYGQTLITAKHFQTACDFIRTKIRKYQNDANLYRLLARAYAENHNLADAYQAKAKAFIIEDYNRQAAILLQQALKIPKLSATDRAIINAKIDQLKEAEKENQL